MKSKRYQLQAMYKGTDKWYTYNTFDDIEKAYGYQRVCASNNPITAERRIWDTQEGKVVE